VGIEIGCDLLKLDRPMTMKKSPHLCFLFIAFIIFTQSLEAQIVKRCHSQDSLLKLVADPQFDLSEYWIIQNDITRYKEAFGFGVPLSGCQTVDRIIPVAIHYQMNATPSEQVCLTELAQSQIDLLNAAIDGDICATGASTGEIIFAIATIDHPSGSNLSDGDPAITFNAAYGCSPMTTCFIDEWRGYLNIVVQDESFIGLSPMPGDPIDPLRQGNAILISQCVFGIPATSCANSMTGFIGSASCTSLEQFDGGKTLVHQVGHFFNLHHTFCSDAESNSSSNGTITNTAICQDARPATSSATTNLSACALGCTTTANPSTVCDCDGVEDTPPQAYAEYNCPGGSAAGTLSNPTTGQDHSYNNYMDYVEDDCMDCFTQEQKFRMIATICAIGDFKVSAVNTTNIQNPPIVPAPAPAPAPLGPGASIPTMSEWGVICLALLFMILGIQSITRRERTMD